MLKTLWLAASCGAFLAAPASAQSQSQTNCSVYGNQMNCQTRDTTPPKIEITPIDVSGALSRYAEAKARSPQTEPTRYFGEDPNAEFVRFREANPWYDYGGLASATPAEKKARALADLTADKYAAQGLQRELPPSAFFARIADEVRKQIPEIAQ